MTNEPVIPNDVDSSTRTVNWYAPVIRLAAAYAALWTVVEVAQNYSIAPFPQTRPGAVVFTSIGLNIFLAMELSRAYARLRRTGRALLPAEPSPDSVQLFEQLLLTEIQKLHHEQDYARLLRYRDAFSALLWSEGHIRERVQLGRLAEDAACQIEDKTRHAAVLIDDLGWSSVALGDYSQAQIHLEHGLAIAHDAKLPYWEARAHRHLAGLRVQEKRFEEAEQKLDISEQIALGIPEAEQRIDMFAGIHFGRAQCAFCAGDTKSASDHLNRSEEIRNAPSRAVKVYALLGKISEQDGQLPLAKDHYRRGRAEAERAGQRDEVIRNLLGLARVLHAERHYDDAQKVQQEADEMLRETPIPYELTDRR